MKVFVPITATAFGLSVALAYQAVSLRSPTELTSRALAGAGSAETTPAKAYMAPLRVIQARVQSDKPVWDTNAKAFLSSFGTTVEEKYRAGLDTVNTASVEGALMYVQAEGIDQTTRGSDITARCTRKNNMKYVVFYDMHIAQTNETLAEYEAEYGPYVAMDGGQCTPSNGSFSAACLSLNRTVGEPYLGPFVGSGDKSSNVRAPYPNTFWYSFPNSCPLSKWVSGKTEACRKAVPGGLCSIGTTPNGIDCTFNYTILGWVPLDDLVGITNMSNAAGDKYKNFSEFCLDNKVEFQGDADGDKLTGIPFWDAPLDSVSNAKRADKLVLRYKDALDSSSLMLQVESNDLANFKPLPTVSELVAENQPCYKNVKACTTATNGCKRDLYSQVCMVCPPSSDSDCKKPPGNFTYPTLVRATSVSLTTPPTPSPSQTPDPDATTDAPSSSSPTPSPTITKSAAPNSSVSLAFALVGSVAASIFLA